MTAALVVAMETTDYDAWKAVFDTDPAGRRQSATGHVLSRSADDPNRVFVRSTFGSVEEAHAFRRRLEESGALGNPSVGSVILPPTVIEVVEDVTY
jgi:hypothetical protein